MIINTYDQLVAAGGGIAICPHNSGIRTTHINGWEVYRVNGKGETLVTDKGAAWYDHGKKVFTTFGFHGTFHEKQAKTLEEAKAWVLAVYGEAGPWKRNRMGDMVPERVHKAFPLEPRKRGAK